MRVTIWQQFSSNHSSFFTVVGVFETPDAAQRAAAEVRQIITSLEAWFDAHPEEADEIFRNGGEDPSPAEIEMGRRFGFEWPYAVSWYPSASVEVVLDRFVYITTTGFRPDSPGEPFDKIMTGLGGQGLLHANAYGDQIGTILADITCHAPSEEAAQTIAKKYLSWDRLSRAEGSRLHFYNWTFSEFDLPEVLEYLKAQGCTDIQYRLYQSEIPKVKTLSINDVDVLIQIIESDQPMDIEYVADALGEIGDVRTVAPLIKALEYGGWFDRIAIAHALGKIGDPRAVDSLIKLVEDHSRDSVAHVAARSLAKIGDPRAIEPLIGLLESDEHWSAGANALGNLGEPARDSITKALQSDNPKIRERAAEALNRINEARDFGPAFLLLRNIDPEIQRQAFETIKRDPRAVEMLIAIMRNPPEPPMRITALNALAEIGDPRAIQPIAELVGDYLGSDGVNALAKFGTLAVEPLMNLMRDTSIWEGTRSSIVWVLSRIADPRSADILLEVLRSPQWEWDYSAIRGAGEGLAAMGEPRAIEPLVKLFIDFGISWHSEQDEWIIDALKKLNGAAELVTRLFEELQKDSDSWIADRNIRALGQLGDKRAIDPLLALSQRVSPQLQSSLDETLQQLGYTKE